MVQVHSIPAHDAGRFRAHVANEAEQQLSSASLPLAMSSAAIHCSRPPTCSSCAVSTGDGHLPASRLALNPEPPLPTLVTPQKRATLGLFVIFLADV